MAEAVIHDSDSEVEVASNFRAGDSDEESLFDTVLPEHGTPSQEGHQRQAPASPSSSAAEQAAKAIAAAEERGVSLDALAGRAPSGPDSTPSAVANEYPLLFDAGPVPPPDYASATAWRMSQSRATDGRVPASPYGAQTLRGPVPHGMPDAAPPLYSPEHGQASRPPLGEEALRGLVRQSMRDDARSFIDYPNERTPMLGPPQGLDEEAQNPLGVTNQHRKVSTLRRSASFMGRLGVLFLCLLRCFFWVLKWLLILLWRLLRRFFGILPKVFAYCVRHWRATGIVVAALSVIVGVLSILFVWRPGGICRHLGNCW